MELKYKLVKKGHNVTEASESWTFVYKPTLEEYTKKCSFTIKTEDPYETCSKLNLPQELGDIIIMDWKPKNVQEKLDKK